MYDKREYSDAKRYRDKVIVELYLKGSTIKEIAEEVGWSTKLVTNVLKSYDLDCKQRKPASKNSK